ncbi:MAG TPA: NYN domain-containing protein [Thermoleophilaceae bacterium]|nr:NYN domain-containing protein [Thermoleophilaceae bacterium]
MSERWIVDGMNVIGSRPDGWWRDRPGAMRSLADQLAAWADGREVTVIFDGAPFDLEAEGVDVRFAKRRGRNAADDDIARLVEQDERPDELRVVTSDNELAQRVRDAGGRVVGAGEFRRMFET